MRDFFHTTDPVSFVFPIDGDCLGPLDGREDGGTVYITVKIRAAENASITVNGKPAAYDDDSRLYLCELPLYNFRNTLYAVDAVNGARADIVVYRLHEPENKFYFTVDDTVVMFYDLTFDGDKYPSIFDHPVLGAFKKAHDLCGAHVHFNIYYEFNADSMADFSAHKKYFNLSMMPDKYRPEFEANSDWLTFSYHANSDHPAMPGRHFGADFFGESIRRTHAEIRRFAGEKSLLLATSQHFGNGPIEVQHAYRDHGYRIQFDSFRNVDNDRPYLGYYGRDGLLAYVRGSGVDAYDRMSDDENGYAGRDYWKDNLLDIIFCHTDMVLNTIKLENIEAWIDKYLSLRPASASMRLMIHEQYFYPDYRSYIPDCAERVLCAVRHLYDKGYRSVPIESIVLE